MYTSNKNVDKVSIPEHFDKEMFTSGATDYWDHESGAVADHDTVTVLFQDMLLPQTYTVDTTPDQTIPMA